MIYREYNAHVAFIIFRPQTNSALSSPVRETVEAVIEKNPPDQTLFKETISLALLSGDIPKVRRYTRKSNDQQSLTTIFTGPASCSGGGYMASHAFMRPLR
jgi:hypothetical protein